MRRLLVVFLFVWIAAAGPRLDAQASQTRSAPLTFNLGEKVHVAGIPNAGKISDQLYRGAQPRAGGLEQLRKLGVTTIVDLRGEDPGTRDSEQKEAERLGMEFISIPISGWNPPTREDVGRFLALFRGDPSKKVFVHCRLGEDRTGVFVATYRMAQQSWPVEQAIHEMDFFGFNRLWHPAMLTYVRNFPNVMAAFAPAIHPVANPSAPTITTPSSAGSR
jgi:tyrosine-protein phosphatase SIW14